VLLLATRNRGKVEEIRAILRDLPVTLESLIGRPAVPDIPEDGLTLRDNALIKARAAFEATGEPSLSDDSGLEVYALGGAPGVRSARYAGEKVSYRENNIKLLAELAHVPDADRGARFVCVAAFVHGEVEFVGTGVCEGSIARAASGDGGFGYDPLFIPSGGTRSFAQFSPEEKNAISHRSAAFRKILPLLAAHFRTPL